MPFLPFLPAAGPEDRDHEEGRACIVSDLTVLSRVSSTEVWRTALQDASLASMLQTLLVYLPRPYEPGYDKPLTSLTLEVLSLL